MAVTTTNLGVITAYGDAVAAGYTGTKAEWQALMASYATVAEEANDAKDDAVAAKNTAVAKATEATTAANTATTKANEASASAQSIAESAAQIQENTDDIDQLMSELTDIRVGADGTTYNSAGAAVRGQISDLREDLIANNSFDIVPENTNGDGNGTDHGVTYTFQGKSACVLTGKATALSTRRILIYVSSVLPADIEVGKSYIIKVSGCDNNAFVRFFFMNGENVISGHNYKVTETTTVTVPSNANGVLMRLEVMNGTDFSGNPRTITYKILNTDTLQESWSAINKITDDLSLLEGNNSADILPDIFNGTSADDHGITFSFPNANTCVLSGTASGLASKVIVNRLNALPSPLTAGDSFVVKVNGATSNIYIRAFLMNGSSVVSGYNFPVYDSVRIVIPSSGVDGILIRVEVTNGTAITGTHTLTYKVLTAYTNKQLEQFIVDPPTYGKYFAFGDSITMGALNNDAHNIATITYPDMVGKTCGLETHNCGVGGQGLVYTGYYDTTALTTVQNTDITGAKLVTLAWGTNDTPSSDFGAVTDVAGAATVCGQMKAVIESIISRDHRAQIVIIGIPRSSLDFDEDGAGGWSRDDYEEAMKTIGRSYCIPFISYHDCTICEESNWNAITSESDRVHPNELGYQTISAYIAGQVSKYFLSKADY